jgi:L-rhamnose isomerase/sugar isomerase
MFRFSAEPKAYAKALLVDRAQLRTAQDSNDVMAAFQILRKASRTDVSPILARARATAGGAIDPIAAYRASGWRTARAAERKTTGRGAGIV